MVLSYFKKNYITKIIIACVLFSSIIACNHKPSPNTLVVGTISGPETELVDVAQKVAKQRFGLNIKIVEFSDYNLPNEALQDGTLDANVYQHASYLKSSIKAHGYKIKAIGRTFVYPAGIYSEKYNTLKSIPVNALIAIPNDPSNESRALVLLEKAKLIRFKRKSEPSIATIVSNPRKLRFQELDAAQLPRVLQDVDAAVINTNYAIPAGLSPSLDALFLENKNSPYANLIVVRTNNKKEEKLKNLVKALNSPEVEAKAKSLFGESAIAAW
jgi:D-methionine transport system substrate-binding protein